MPTPQLHCPMLPTWIQGLQADRTVLKIQTYGGCILRPHHWRRCGCTGASETTHGLRARRRRAQRVELSGARPPGGLSFAARTTQQATKKLQNRVLLLYLKGNSTPCTLSFAAPTIVENGRVGHRLEVTASSPGFGLLLSDQARHMPPGPCRRPEPTRASSRPRAPSQSGRA